MGFLFLGMKMITFFFTLFFCSSTLGQEESPAIEVTNSITAQARKAILDVHNKARREVGVGPMTWNNTVAEYAQNYANSRLKGDCKLEHSQGGPYGENLVGNYGTVNAPGAVKFWLTEKKDYVYATNSCVGDGVCGHYTQMVWRNSVQLGCGAAKCANNWVFFTCNYYPPGNYMGERPY